jgi:hypothetical protein
MIRNTDYEEFVRRLFKTGADIELDELSKTRVHAALGCADEMFELLEAAWLYKKKEAARADVLEELGDLAFYLEAVRQTLPPDLAAQALERQRDCVANVELANQVRSFELMRSVLRLVSLLKKATMYNKRIPETELAECWAVCAVAVGLAGRNDYAIHPAIIADANMEKLRKRYPSGYSDQAAQERADKKEGGA